ncbi:hypothetical protein ES703_30892 [subsurface metagenome]
MDIRKATMEDLPAIIRFVDYWLAGRAKTKGVEFAGDDYFISPRQHRKYINQYDVVLAFDYHFIVGWAVKQHQQTLIHLLISADHRGKGIGKKLLKALDPRIIRCKTDQSTGDPTSFFKKHGYKRLSNIKIGRRRQIQLLTDL